MFKHLFNFNYQRNTKEAIGFCFAYVFFFFSIFFITGVFISFLNEMVGYDSEITQQRALSLGLGIEIITTFIFFIVFLIKKNLPKKKNNFQAENDLNSIEKKRNNTFREILKIVSLFLIVIFSILFIILLYNIIELFQDIIYLMISETSN